VEKRSHVENADRTSGMISVISWLHANAGVTEGLSTTDGTDVPALFESFETLARSDLALNAA
jgi:hypothetical protein